MQKLMHPSPSEIVAVLEELLHRLDVEMGDTDPDDETDESIVASQNGWKMVERLSNKPATSSGFKERMLAEADAYILGVEDAAALHESVNPASDAERLRGDPGAGAMGAVIEYRDKIRALLTSPTKD